MANWFPEIRLHLLGIAMIPLVGVVLIRWGLWGERSRGRGVWSVSLGLTASDARGFM